MKEELYLKKWRKLSWKSFYHTYSMKPLLASMAASIQGQSFDIMIVINFGHSSGYGGLGRFCGVIEVCGERALLHPQKRHRIACQHACQHQLHPHFPVNSGTAWHV